MSGRFNDKEFFCYFVQKGGIVVKVKPFRDKNKVVQKLYVWIDGYWGRTFCRGKNGEPVEIGQGVVGDRLYDYEKLWIPNEIYSEMMRMVLAIFKERPKRESKQMSLFERVESYTTK